MTRKKSKNASVTFRRKKKGGRDKAPATVTVSTGKVQMSREGFLYVIPDDGMDSDIFVPKNKTLGALNGDIVKVTVTKRNSGRKRAEGCVSEIIQRSTKPFVGTLHIVGTQAWVLMESRNMPYDIVIPMDREQQGHLYPAGSAFNAVGVVDEEGDAIEARSGMKVAAVVDFWHRHEQFPTGHITDILGESGKNDTQMHAILAEYELPYRFEPEVAKAADAISDKITKKDLEGRKDFRDTLTFTIDPSDAKDFDDALSFRQLDNGNFEVGVHIADVTYYVRPGSIVDDEARSRGTSVYLVDRTVPMLPEKLSNKLCSLRPGEEKLCFSAVFEITRLGRTVSSWIGRTVICSDWRFDYDGAQVIIKPDHIPQHTSEGCAVSKGEVPQNLRDAILTLNSIAEKLRKKRFAAGAISFDRPEMKVIVDEEGKPVDVLRKVSFEANWLIEEFMLLANRTVAEYVGKQKKTFVYRVHDLPDPVKLENLGKFVGNFGYKFKAGEGKKGVSTALNQLFLQAQGTPEAGAIEMLGLRTMAKAKYTTDNIGHYGLAFDWYTHFTSPIRRYPDMMVHRLLAAYLDKGSSADKIFYENECVWASARESVAAEAERASIKYKMVEYMQDKVGDEFVGHVSGLTEWGMYVEVDPTKIEGMVPLRDIRTDFFEFDSERYILRGRRTRKVFRLGDEVKVRVKRASLEQMMLDYELIEDNKAQRRRPGHSSKTRSR